MDISPYFEQDENQKYVIVKDKLAPDLINKLESASMYLKNIEATNSTFH